MITKTVIWRRGSKTRKNDDLSGVAVPVPFYIVEDRRKPPLVKTVLSMTVDIAAPSVVISRGKEDLRWTSAIGTQNSKCR